MTTATATSPTGSSQYHLTFPRIVLSEWVKLRSLRSTMWCFAIMIVLIIGLAALVAFALGSQSSQLHITTDAQRHSIFVTTATLGVTFAQLVLIDSMNDTLNVAVICSSSSEVLFTS